MQDDNYDPIKKNKEVMKLTKVFHRIKRKNSTHYIIKVLTSHLKI